MENPYKPAKMIGHLGFVQDKPAQKTLGALWLFLGLAHGVLHATFAVILIHIKLIDQYGNFIQITTGLMPLLVVVFAIVLVALGIIGFVAIIKRGLLGRISLMFDSVYFLVLALLPGTIYIFIGWEGDVSGKIGVAIGAFAINGALFALLLYASLKVMVAPPSER